MQLLPMMRAMHSFPFILTISSEKGGVGKTTLATNLAIYLKAMQPELLVTILSFDNHFTVDKMFELKGQQQRGTVADLLSGVPATELVLQGQYGVQYIPSSNQLTELYREFKGPMALCRMMAESGLSGIVLIDTRPDLNILTQNALYAADRVLIPVKDMPSLENCKHIFALFDQRGIDKKSLSLIPCLIDNRIKYDGIFKDQRTLLKAFAINRGYRCLETYISKSPKVESLNTNPDGKIYPILSHARDTEVHSQFSELTHDILTNYHATPESRACLYHSWQKEQESQKKELFLARLEGIPAHCVICGSSLDGPAHKGFFYESSDRANRGFLHSDCFASLLCTMLYQVPATSEAQELSRQMVMESARQSVAVFLPLHGADGEYRLRFLQLDQQGAPLLERNIALAGFSEGRFDGVLDQLYLLLNESLAGYDGGLRNGWLTVYPVDEERPQLALHEQNYRRLQERHRQIEALLAS